MIKNLEKTGEQEYILEISEAQYALFSNIEPGIKSKYTYSDHSVKILVINGKIDVTIVDTIPFIHKNIKILKPNEFVEIKENTLFSISNLYEESAKYIKFCKSNYNLIEFEEEDFANGRIRSFLDG